MKGMTDIERMIQALESGKTIRLEWVVHPGWIRDKLEEIKSLAAEMQKIVDRQNSRNEKNELH